MPRVPRRKMNEFGRTVMVIAMEHGLETRADLLHHLEDHGDSFSSERVGGWFYGRNQVDRSFPRALKKSIPLTPEQHTRLAVAYLDGQGPAQEMPAA